MNVDDFITTLRDCVEIACGGCYLMGDARLKGSWRGIGDLRHNGCGGMGIFIPLLPQTKPARTHKP